MVVIEVAEADILVGGGVRRMHVEEPPLLQVDEDVDMLSHELVFEAAEAVVLEDDVVDDVVDDGASSRSLLMQVT